jgi:hypothetical protein
VTADPDPATGPKAAHFKIDGGTVQSAATTGSPGVATVSVPAGVHTLEFWGEDRLGQEETTHHVISAGCEASSPGPPVPLSAQLPTLTGVTQSHRVWRAGNGLTSASAKQPPIGTTFSFTLNEQVHVQLTFTQTAAGRKVNGHCVAQTKRNRADHPCKRSITRGVLAVTGHAGPNKIAFQGRLSRSQRLKPGVYVLTIAATNISRTGGASARLTFKIVP